MKKSVPRPAAKIAGKFVIPNHSGDLSAGDVLETPSQELDPVNKQYVDSLIHGNIDLFFTNNASDIGGYKDMEVEPVTAAEETITQTITANSTTLIEEFITLLDDTLIDSLSALEMGVYTSHFHALATKATGMTIYFEFYKRTAGGTETLLGTSHDSDTLGLTESQYEVHASILTDTIWIPGDRVVLKIYGRNTGGADKDISLLVESNTLSRVEFPAFIPPTAGGGGAITNLDGGNSADTFIAVGLSPIDGGDST